MILMTGGLCIVCTFTRLGNGVLTESSAASSMTSDSDLSAWLQVGAEYGALIVALIAVAVKVYWRNKSKPSGEKSARMITSDPG